MSYASNLWDDKIGQNQLWPGFGAPLGLKELAKDDKEAVSMTTGLTAIRLKIKTTVWNYITMLAHLHQ